MDAKPSQMDETNTSHKCIGTHVGVSEVELSTDLRDEYQGPYKKPRYLPHEWHDLENVHENDWCHLFNDDTDTEDDESWEKLINDAFETHDDTYQGKIQGYMTDGLSEKKATQKASHDLHKKYRTTLMNNYREIVLSMHSLRGSAIHHNIMEYTEKLMNKYGYRFATAFERALKKNKMAFEELIEEEESDSSSSESLSNSSSSERDMNDTGTDELCETGSEESSHGCLGQSSETESEDSSVV